jgi:F-type H+-transporting ATPase subunit delta
MDRRVFFSRGMAVCSHNPCRSTGRFKGPRFVFTTVTKKGFVLADEFSSAGPVVSGIAGRYASALFDLASEARQTAAVGKDLSRFDALVAGSADLSRLVKSPAFSSSDQVAAVSAVLTKARIGGLAGNFIRLVASKRRLFVIRDMVSAYHALADVRAGVVKADVVVAEKLSDKNRKAVLEALKGVTGKNVSISEKVDPSIIGGLIVKLGSRMVDSSVRTKLNSLKVAMKEAG